jgi:hypothetical protein
MNMPKAKTLVVRVDESLIQLIQETAKILERKESETIRILLHRACKYWIARGTLTKTSTMITTINEQSTSTPMATDDDEIAKLQEAMKLLK